MSFSNIQLASYIFPTDWPTITSGWTHIWLRNIGYIRLPQVENSKNNFFDLENFVYLKKIFSEIGVIEGGGNQATFDL